MKAKISDIKLNPNNPRVIKDDKFQKLVSSIKEFPKMLELRPIIVNDDMVVLGGNMRLKACIEAGMKEVYILKAKDLTEAEQKEFIIKDNISYGEWEWSVLENWNAEDLENWGLEIFKQAEQIDYSLLEETDVSETMQEMNKNIKKSIQIEFDNEHYEKAYELVSFWREQKLYIGKYLMDKLQEEKNKLDV